MRLLLPLFAVSSMAASMEATDPAEGQAPALLTSDMVSVEKEAPELDQSASQGGDIRRSLTVLVALLAAVAAVVFLVFQCFKALRPDANSGRPVLETRRLAAGGSDPCSVRLRRQKQCTSI